MKSQKEYIEWWNYLLNCEREIYSINYFNCGSNQLSLDNIEEIWEKETHFQGFFEIKK